MNDDARSLANLLIAVVVVALVFAAIIVSEVVEKGWITAERDSLKAQVQELKMERASLSPDSCRVMVKSDWYGDIITAVIACRDLDEVSYHTGWRDAARMFNGITRDYMLDTTMHCVKAKIKEPQCRP